MTDLRRPGRLQVGDDVAVEAEPSADGRVYLATLPDGPLVCLEGSATVIWREAIGSRASEVAARVAERVGVPVAEVGPDVERFLTELAARGFLVEDAR